MKRERDKKIQSKNKFTFLSCPMTTSGRASSCLHNHLTGHDVGVVGTRLSVNRFGEISPMSKVFGNFLRVNPWSSLVEGGKGSYLPKW